MAHEVTDQDAKEAHDAVTAEKGTPEYSRRQFLGIISAGVGAVGAVLVGIPFVSFLMAPLLKEPPEVWQAVRIINTSQDTAGTPTSTPGEVNNFKVGETVEVAFEDSSPLAYAGVSAQTAAWLRRESETGFRAFAVNCTHLGCPVQWVPDGQIFLCPCHGGVYYQDGQVAAGPPPKSLPEYQVRVKDGHIEILSQRVPIA